MHFVSIFVLGLLGTAYMLGLDAAAVRLGLIRANFVQAIGKLIMPEQVRSPLAHVSFSLGMGVVFAATYAYLFQTLNLADLRDYLTMGVLTGFVHGFFVSFFFAFGLSAVDTGETVRPFTFPSSAVNVLTHVVFGGIVGVGLGFLAKTGSLTSYAGFLALAGVAEEGLLLLLVPRRLEPVRVSIRRGV